MQAYIGTQTLTATVHRHHERIITAADTDVEFPIIRYHQRLDGQTMRSDRCEDDASALRRHQRTTDGEVICRTAGRRSDNQTV